MDIPHDFTVLYQGFDRCNQDGSPGRRFSQQVDRLLHGGQSWHTPLHQAFAVHSSFGLLHLERYSERKTLGPPAGRGRGGVIKHAQQSSHQGCLMLLVWTDGQSRVPAAYRVWYKGGHSKVDLAFELLTPVLPIQAAFCRRKSFLWKPFGFFR
jgi:hypothetical protein